MSKKSQNKPSGKDSKINGNRPLSFAEIEEKLHTKYIILNKSKIIGLTTLNIIVAILTTLASYKLIVTHKIVGNSSALFPSQDNSNERITKYKKKFVIWTPEFSKKQYLKIDSVGADSIFHGQLQSLFGGGWTRWTVEGGWQDGGRETREKGWFYEFATEKEDIQKEDITKILQDFWIQKSWYITEIPLNSQQPKSDTAAIGITTYEIGSTSSK